MSSFTRVPVVDVHIDNINEVWPSMILAMSNASFVALDTELSGLGHRKKLNAKSVEDRYQHIVETSRSRSILSLGISCFQQMAVPSSQGSQAASSTFIVQTFNLLLLCEEDFLVEPASLKFLVHHGFDFNKQFEKGIPYYRGKDRTDTPDFKSPRHLFAELVSMNVPIILHNGLVDLMFLYENLYTSLPATSNVFLADLGDMFQAGVVDTKYITDFEHLMQASYLEYVFRKCQKDNQRGTVKCVVHHPHYPASYTHVTYRDCAIKPPFNIEENPDVYKQALCESYAGHGWCSKTKFCLKSHDIDLIIDLDIFIEGRKSRKRKRRQQNRKERDSFNDSSSDKSGYMDSGNHEQNGSNEDNSAMEVSGENGATLSKGGDCDSNIDTDKQQSISSLTVEDVLKKVKGQDTDNTDLGTGCHRAGYDAFMTGFIFAVYQQRQGGTDQKVAEWKNKIYLTGKDYPLTISQSGFVKQSKLHQEKIQKIRNKVENK